MNFCLMIYPQHPDNEINEIIKMMQEPTYQRVCGGRPLLYLLIWEPNDSVERYFGTIEKGRAYMDDLRKRIMATGQKNPYLVTLSQKPEIGAAVARAAGLDAISAYTSWGGTNYAGLSSTQIQYWNAMKSTGLKVVPNISAGWGGPRDGNGDTFQPSPGELANHVRSAAEWINENPATAEAKTMLFYAWNEVDEGGWLVPDKGQGTAKLDAIRSVVDQYRALEN